MEEFNEIRKRIKIIIDLYVKRVYVMAFNVYSFYWLYKIVFIKENTTWEDWFLWFFTTTGMYFFVIDNQDINFRNKKRK